MMHSLLCVDYAQLRGGLVFVCYAHTDNESSNPKERWLDRLLEFLRPLLRQKDELSLWSDTKLVPGDHWHVAIQAEIKRAKVAILLVSPAFLASDYIARSEVPVFLKQAKRRGSNPALRILPVIISPCLYEETVFKYPDWLEGPHELNLGSLQSINPPSKTLSEMTEAEQNRVLLAMARQVIRWIDTL